jgi:hypothetical protein
LGHSQIQNRPLKRRTPPSRIMLGGVLLELDSAIPQYRCVRTEREKVHRTRPQAPQLNRPQIAPALGPFLCQASRLK